MRALTRKERLTGQVGISLLAGMFSMVPAAFGMPVADTTHANDPTSMITKGSNSMDVTGGTGSDGHYVAAWTDFSVAQGEKVTFDHGDIGKNDYLNLVTGQATSDIAGEIKGGRNVYLVNPNGVIFAEGAQVNVGNLYVSTQPLPDTDKIDTFKTNGTSPLTSGTGTADVVNLGTLAADKIEIEGKNIRVLDTSQILTANKTAVNSGSNVALHSNGGYIHVGYRADSEGTAVTPGYVENYGKDTGKLSATELGYYTTTAGALTNYRLVHNASELQHMDTDLGGNYMLADDITAGTITAIGDEDTPFSGKFDGMFYEVKNLQTEGGLFGAIKDATIENVGVVGGSVTGKEYKVPYATGSTIYYEPPVKAAGALVGYAYGKNTLTNVYNEGVSVKDSSAVNGGLVGYAGAGTSTAIIPLSTLTISRAYNTGTVGSGTVTLPGKTSSELVQGGGIVGHVSGVSGSGGTATAEVNLTNTYSTGAVTGYGMIGGLSGTAAYRRATITTSYATPSDANGATQNSLAPSVDYVTSPSSYVTTSTAKADYSGFNISNVGGEGTIWRIYEGQTQPLLTAFFKGKAAVSLSDANVSNGISGSSTAASALHFEENGVEKVYDGRAIKVGNLQGYVSGNVASSNIKKSPAALTGQQVGYTGETSKNAGTYALVYSGQHGYDIVGGNATIKKRPLTISNDANMLLSKVYDGGAIVAVGTKAKDLFTASAGEVGLVEGDEVDLAGEVKVKGGFYESADNKTASPDVGTGKYVELVFDGLGDELTGSDKDNYEFTNGLTPDGDGKSTLTSNNGVITPRGILVNLKKSSGIDKVYDGTKDVTDSGAAAAIYDANDANPTGNLVFQKTSTNVGTGLLNADENYLDLDYATTVAYDSQNASSSENDRKIDYSGLKLKLTAAGAALDEAKQAELTKNYYLTDGSSVLYYGGNDLVATLGSGNATQQVKLFQQTNLNDGGTLTATGTIERRAITTGALKINGSTGKVYDGTSAVENLSGVTVSIDGANTGNANTANIMLTDADKIAFHVVEGKFVDETQTHEAVNATASGINDGTNGYAAKYASYGVQVSSTDADLLNNYTFDSQDDDVTEILTPLNAGTVYDGTNTAGAFYGDGTITQRTVNVMLPQGKTGITKAYDGGVSVTDAAVLGFGGDYVQYVDPSDTDHQILASDASSVNFGVAAAYDTENVKRDAAGNVLTNKHDIAYTVGLTGAKAGNYLVHDAAATDASGDKTAGVQLATKATGTITPLSVGIDDYAVSKVYDGTKEITNTNIALTNVLSGDTDKVSVTVDGTKSHYTDKNAGTGKEVTLSGFALSGEKAVNYDLVGAPETVTGNYGTITPRKLLTGDFTLSDDATKVYDGTTAYDGANGKTLSSELKEQGDTSGTGIIKGDKITFTVTEAAFNNPNATDYQSGFIGIVGGQSGAQSLNYKAQASGADIGNYTFDGENALQNVDGDGNPVSYGGFSRSGTITPRVVQLAVTSGAEKPYDGATTVTNTNGYLEFNAGDAASGSNLEGLYNAADNGYSTSGHVVYGTSDTDHQFLEGELGTQAAGGDKVYLNISAAYKTKNVIRDANGNAIEANPLTYTVSIGGDNAGNYRLYNGTTPVGNQARGASVTFTKDAAQNDAMGKITPLDATATFVNVDKVYDGKADVDTSSLNMSNVTFDNVLPEDRAKMSVVNSALTGNYSSSADGEGGKNVHVVGGTAAAKPVSLTGVSGAFTDASGGNAYSDTYAVGNYDFADAATGTGKITPRPVGELVLKNGNNEITEVSKTYDGSVYYTDELGNTVEAKKTGVEPGDKTTGILSGDEVSFAIDTSNGNSYFADAAGTKNANATGYNGGNTGAQQLIYKVKVTGGSASNYTFDAAPLVDGNSYDAGSVKGVINRRAITVGQDLKTGIDKIYNGDAEVADTYEGFGLTVDSDNNGVKDHGYVVYAGDSANDAEHQLVTTSPDDDTALNVGWNISATYDDMQVGGKTLAGKDVYLVNGNPAAKNVTYTVSLTGDAAGNYILNGESGTNANPPTVKLTGATGTIAQKEVNVIASAQGITKVYDGNTKVTADNLQAGTTVAGKIEADDVYAYADVGELKYTDKNVGDAITLTGIENIGLAGNDVDNYKLVDVTLPTGKITKRTLYVDFKGTTPGVDDGTGIDRDYNGTSDATVPTEYQKIVKLVTAVDGDTGVVTSENATSPDDVALSDTYSAAYMDGNVARDPATGKVTTKEVYYYGFELTGADAGNYEVAPATGKASSFTKDATTYNALTGEGTITPLKIGVYFDPVKKTYDGSTAIADSYIANGQTNDPVVASGKTYDLVTDQQKDAADSTIVTNIHRTLIDVIKDGDSINVSLDKDKDEAKYQQKDAGINLGVEYYIVWDNMNYELVAMPTSDSSVLVTETSYADGKVRATVTGYKGTITPATITALKANEANKVYDGNDQLTDVSNFITSASAGANGELYPGDSLNVTGKGTYAEYTDPVTGETYSGATSSTGESAAAPILHDIHYEDVQINNNNYILKDVDTYDEVTGLITRGTTELDGKGVINRATLTVKPYDVNLNQAVASTALTYPYKGDVTGFKNGEEPIVATNAASAANGQFYFGLDPSITSTPPSGTPIYGWYRNQDGKKVGIIDNDPVLPYYGQNYKLVFETGTLTYYTPSPSGGGGGTPGGGTSGGGGGGGITPIPYPTPGGGGGTGGGPGGGSTGGGTGGGPGGGGTGGGTGGGPGGGGGGTNPGTLPVSPEVASAVLTEAGSKKVTPDNTILVQVSRSDGLAEAANAAETPYSSATVTYKSTGINATAAGTGQIVGISSNAAVDSEIALESSAGSVFISNDSNTESTAELERSDATVNITTQGGTRSSISLNTSEDGVNLSSGARSDATTKTTASSSEQMETSSGISIRVQKDDTEEDTETGEEDRSKKQDSSLIGLETLKDAVNLGAPMDTAV